MSDTTMLRVSTELRDKLKAKAKAEGRTLEWTANQALNEFLLPKPANVIQPAATYKESGYKTPRDAMKDFNKPLGNTTYNEPTYEPMDDVA